MGTAVHPPGCVYVDGRWLWWDGGRYTAEWNGVCWVPVAAASSARAGDGLAGTGLGLFFVTAILFWVLGVVTGPAIVGLGAMARRRSSEVGGRTTFGTVVIVLGVIAFVFGLLAAVIVSDPDFQM